MLSIRLENLNIWIKILKKLYSLVFLSIWALFAYQCFLIYTTNKDFLIRIINLEFMEDKTMIDTMISLGIHCVKVLGIFIAALIVYSIIKNIFRSIPLPTILINKWNNTNQISPMLAHRLIAHYTYNTRLSFYDLINIYDASSYEANNLSYNFNNKNLAGLFKRFNPNLVSEILIYNTYFPYMNIWQKTKTFLTGKPFRKPLQNTSTPQSNVSSLNLNKQDDSSPSIDRQEPTIFSTDFSILDATTIVSDTKNDSETIVDNINENKTDSVENEKIKPRPNPFLETKKSNNE